MQINADAAATGCVAGAGVFRADDAEWPCWGSCTAIGKIGMRRPPVGPLVGVTAVSSIEQGF